MATANEYLPIDGFNHVTNVDDLDLMNNTAFSDSLKRNQDSVVLLYIASKFCYTVCITKTKMLRVRKYEEISKCRVRISSQEHQNNNVVTLMYIFMNVIFRYHPALIKGINNMSL